MEGYYLMPHPLMMIHTIGQGEDLKLYQISLACHDVAKEIATSQPTTIVILTSDGTKDLDGISLSCKESIRGQLKEGFSLDIELDSEFNDALIKAVQLESKLAYLLKTKTSAKSGDSSQLDSKALVPLYFIHKYYQNYKLVPIQVATCTDRELYQFGMLLQQVTQTLNKKVVLIASGDLSHKVSTNEKCQYSIEGEAFNHEFLNQLTSNEPLGIFDFDQPLVEEAVEDVLAVTKILMGALDGKEINGEVLAYQCPFGVGHSVVKFKELGPGPKRLKYIGSQSQDVATRLETASNPYVKLARICLEDYFNQTKTLITSNLLPEIMVAHRHGVFVTLMKAGKRCAWSGTVIPTTDCVASEIMQNTLDAIQGDEGESPISEEELKDIKISIDLLLTKESELLEKLSLQSANFKGVPLSGLEKNSFMTEALEMLYQRSVTDFDEKFLTENFEVIHYQEAD